MMNNNYLITIIGATGIGKTKLSIDLAQHYNCEIISGDSRQFFKEMQIGTAVPSNEELSKIKHHFIQHISIHEPYNVGKFEKEALIKLNKLFSKNNFAILIGGSGLYINAILNGLDNFPEVSESIRSQLNKQFKEQGIHALQQLLKTVDFESYKQIDLKNPHRVIRALEVFLSSGRPYSYYRNKPKSNRNFTPIIIGLTADRNIIYNRIEQRIDLMIASGLVDEAKNLYPFKDKNALNTVGYKELFEYFEKRCSLEYAIEEIKKNTRRFAKRQITWFKKTENTHWFDYQTPINDITKVIDHYTRE